MQEIQKIKQRQENFSISNRIIHDTINGFYFDDENGLLIEKDNGYKSLTFAIYRDAPSAKLENIVFSLKQDNEYEPFLSKYTLTEQQWQMLDNGQTPQFSANEIDIIPLDSSASAKCGWNFEQHLNVAGTSYIMEWTYTACGGGGDGAGTGGNNTGSSNGTGGVKDTTPSPNSPATGMLTSPVGTNPHGGAGGGVSQNFPDTPCGRIQKGTSSNVYKQKFKVLNKPSSFSLSRESGFVEKIENGVKQYVNATPSGSTSMDIPPGSLNYTHVHNNISVTTESGDELDVNVKMPSPVDLSTLISTCSNSQINANSNPREAFGVMISNEGIFAITLLEPFSLNERTQLNSKWIKFEKDYIKMAKEIILNFNNNASTRKDKLQKMLLQLLKDAGLENKIGLFEGTVENELSSINLNWNRKILAPNSTPNNQQLIEEPCN